MRSQLLASTALATFAATSAIAASPAPVFTWTGCYVGLHAGVGWGDSTWTPAAPFFGVSRASIDASGAIGGGQAGCNYQAQNFVLGVEGEIWGSGLTGSTTFADFEGAETLKTNSHFSDDAALRVGYAVDHALLFGKIGVASASAHFNDAYKNDFEGFSERGAATSAGLLVGLGLEYALDAHWSVKGEYDYIDFGSRNVAMTGNFFSYAARIRDYENIMKVGGNYRF